jgi:hypothetical protein
MYIGTYVHPYMYTHGHTYVHRYIHMYIGRYICTYICAYVEIRVREIPLTQGLPAKKNENVISGHYGNTPRLSHRTKSRMKSSKKFGSEFLRRGYVSAFISRDRCYDFKNIFAEFFCEKMAFVTQNKGKFWKKLIITLVFKKNANFFAENWKKSPKIVIITSTPDHRIGKRWKLSAYWSNKWIPVTAVRFL